MKTLRILFTVVSAVLIAAIVPIGALCSWTAAGICGLSAILFFILMRLCKQKQEEDEKRARHADFDDGGFLGGDSVSDRADQKERGDKK